MKIIYLFLLSTIPFPSINAQTRFNSSRTGEGEGVVTVNSYWFHPGDTVTDNTTVLPENRHFERINYFVKHNRVLRKDTLPMAFGHTDGSQQVDSQLRSQTSISLYQSDPGYLIDLDSGTVYIGLKNQGKSFVATIPLKDFTSDNLYFNLFSDVGRIIAPVLQDKTPVLIKGHTCYKGVAILAALSRKITFYYTRDTMKVRSPLNYFFDTAKFPYDVIQIDQMVRWEENGKEREVPFIYQLENSTECRLDDSLFFPDPKLPVIRNMSFQDIQDCLLSGN